MRSLILNLSRIPKMWCLEDPIKSFKYFLKLLTEDLDFASSPNSSHASIVYEMKLFPYLPVLNKELFSFLLRRVKRTSLHVWICSDRYKRASPLKTIKLRAHILFDDPQLSSSYSFPRQIRCQHPETMRAASY